MAALVLGFASAVGAAQPVVEATEAALKEAGSAKAVVLLDVYWARAWRCGQFENAQLRSLVFERAPLAAPGEAAAGPTLALENPSRLMAPKGYVPYALVIEPGEYHLTGFEVGFARSVRDVGATVVKRSGAIVNGASRLGHFSAHAGEVVYLGHFAVDCYRDPIPWRFYSESGRDLDAQLAEYKDKYPALPIDKVTYRLFSTTELGTPVDVK
ncbi:MAG: hypothetical protein ACOZJX_13360 [Pseudomonadota bacterium]